MNDTDVREVAAPYADEIGSMNIDIQRQQALIDTLLAALKRARPALWILATCGNPDAVAIHRECLEAIDAAERK